MKTSIVFPAAPGGFLSGPAGRGLVLLFSIDFAPAGAGLLFARAKSSKSAPKPTVLDSLIKKFARVSIDQGELAALTASINGEGYFIDTVAPATGATF